MKNRQVKLNITSKKDILAQFKNYQILSLEPYDYTNDSYYRKLFELLQLDTSVDKLYIMYNDYRNSDEFYRLLSDFLTTSTHLKHIRLKDNHISVENSMLLSDAIKNNDSLIHINLNYKNLDSNAFKYLINSLKINKMLKFIVISIWDNYIDGNDIAELLKVNTSVFALELYTSEIKNHNVIIKALKNNRYITLFFSPSDVILDQNVYKKIITYSERNKYNQELKSMRIQDL